MYSRSGFVERSVFAMTVVQLLNISIAAVVDSEPYNAVYLLVQGLQRYKVQEQCQEHRLFFSPDFDSLSKILITLLSLMVLLLIFSVLFPVPVASDFG